MKYWLDYLKKNERRLIEESCCVWTDWWRRLHFQKRGNLENHL